MQTEAMDIVTEARTWIGVRWQHQGRSREGVDCAGLVVKVAHKLGLSEFDIANYERHAVDETMLDLCHEHLLPVSPEALRPGDVLVMRFEHQRHMAIVGDYLWGGLSIVHAYAPSRQVVEMRLDSVWLDRVIGRFRFPGGV